MQHARQDVHDATRRTQAQSNPAAAAQVLKWALEA
jgi:hypothetical protein